MNTNISLRKFIVDGLVGVAVVLIIFVVLGIIESLSLGRPPGAYRSADFSVAYIINDFLPKSFFVEMYGGKRILGPIPFAILTTFIGVGIGGPFLETITSRKDWGRPLLKTSGISFLAGLGLFVIYGILLGTDLLLILLLILIGGIGLGFGLVFGILIGGLVGAVFNPHKRLYKIMIGAVSSAMVGLGGTLGLILLAFGP